MEDFRSKSCRDGSNSRMQMEPYSYNSSSKSNVNINTHTGYGPTSMQDLRCYSASYAGSSSYHNSQQQEVAPPPPYLSKEVKMKKAKSMSKSWSFVDPELQRKKRVASYKVYSVEGKMKGSIKKSFRWIKNTCNQVVYGWW